MATDGHCWREGEKEVGREEGGREKQREGGRAGGWKMERRRQRGREGWKRQEGGRWSTAQSISERSRT